MRGHGPLPDLAEWSQLDQVGPCGPVPSDHLVRKIAAVLDLSWVHSEVAGHYSNLGQPSIDPEVMLRILILGYVFGIRSERPMVREV